MTARCTATRWPPIAELASLWQVLGPAVSTIGRKQEVCDRLLGGLRNEASIECGFTATRVSCTAARPSAYNRHLGSRARSLNHCAAEIATVPDLCGAARHVTCTA